MTLPSVSHEQLQKAELQRQYLRAKLQARQTGGDLSSALAAPAAPLAPAEASTPSAPLLPIDHLKALGLYRPSVRAMPVRTGYQVKTIRTPAIFPITPATRLGKLGRSVIPAWRQILTSVSSASVAGGRCHSSQGRNLITIIEEVRKRCYLKTDGAGQPQCIREQVVLTVEGETHGFARACGMSASTFYRALRHPLAHLFLRTQKVQREREGQRENVATLFSVSMFEPEVPVDLEAAFYAEGVEQAGVLVVSDFTCQDATTKERPSLNQIQREPVENRTPVPGLSEAAPIEIRQVVDSALLGSPARAAFDHSGKEGSAAAEARAAAGGSLEIAAVRRPDFLQLARDMADFHDAPEIRDVATVGYYKALMYLDLQTVMAEVRVIARWRKQGQRITNSGALLMSLLNKKTRKQTGFNIRDLGLEPGRLVV